MYGYDDYIFFGDDPIIFAHFQESMADVAGSSLKKVISFEELNSYLEAHIDQCFPLLFFLKGDSWKTDLEQLHLLASKYKKVMIFLVGDKLSASEKEVYFKAGVTNTVSPNASKDVFMSLRKYVHLYFEAIAQNTDPIGLSYSGTKRFKTPLGKRLSDIVLSLILIIIFSPLFLIIFLAIKLESKGPAVYKSKRIGSGYYMFDFFKFRSMYRDADKRLREYMVMNQYAKQESNVPSTVPVSYADLENHQLTDQELQELLISDDVVVRRSEVAGQNKKAAFFKLEKDPRVTKVGRILRKYSLDELPQLFNVLIGDMSIVGNRPLPLYEAEALTTDDSVERFMAPAGITGLWQVEKRGDNGSMSDKERVDLDIFYAKNYSFMMDVKILYKTFFAFIQKADV